MSEQTITAERDAAGKSGVFSTLMNYKIGVLPVPVYVVLAAVVLTSAYVGKLPNDIIGGLAIMLVMGGLLWDMGGKIPVLKDIGGPAIMCVFVPSALVGYSILSPDMVKTATTLLKTTNFLYLYIAILVAGSILGMNRKVLVQGFIRMFVPLLVGTIASITVGCLVGLLFGYSIKHTFFFIVVPIIGGGVGEGILPLSIAYSEILGKPQPEFVDMLIPAAMLANVVAIISAGILKRIGEKKPQYNGNGLLVKTGEDTALLEEQKRVSEKPVEFPLMGAGVLIACTFFLFGGLTSKLLFGIPGPIIMILTAAAIKAINVMPAKMEQGAYHVYRFFTASFTSVILVGLGVVYVPWKDLVKAFTPGYFAICIATVLAMVSSGWIVGYLLKMYPVEAAVVTGCHSGLGGTGDVAILSAAHRMELMPFAQISTRIGGATMVVIAVFLLKIFGVE